MGAILLSLLISVLSGFLVTLFKNWLTSKFPALGGVVTTSEALFPTKEELAAAKPAFVASVKWKFWLGFNRSVNAGKVYDKMCAKYEAPETLPVLADGFSRKDFAPLVKHLTDGITLD